MPRQQLLEHDAKELIAAAGVAIPEGGLASGREEAGAIARRLGGRVVVKAQVPAAGRRRCGGIEIVEAGDAAPAAATMLGSAVCGHRVGRVLVERYVAGGRELFFGLAIDARARAPRLLLSGGGGSGIESSPAPVGSCPVSVLTGLRDWHVWRSGGRAGLDRATTGLLVDLARRAYRVFSEQQAEVLEINPLLVPAAGPPVAADVRLVPAAGSRPGPDDQEPEGAFLELDRGGDVGLLSTGAGASMLQVDLLREAGLRPTNFCDLRTGGLRGSPARLVEALRRLGACRGLRCVGVNVFASITDLEEFVALLLAALGEAPPRVPVIVRIEGEAAAAGRRRLAAAGLTCARDLDHLVELMRRSVGSPTDPA